MASVTFPGVFDIDYSIADCRIRSFELNGVVLYDEKGIIIQGWEEKLIEIVEEFGMDSDDGMGLHAFMLPYIQNGSFITSKREIH